LPTLHDRRAVLTFVASGAATLAVALSLALAFRAGCAGDAKSGALGDPAMALRIEDAAAVCGWLGIGFAILAVLCAKRRSMIRSLAIAVALGLLGSLGLMLAGMQLEIWGVSYCF